MLRESHTKRAFGFIPSSAWLRQYGSFVLLVLALGSCAGDPPVLLSVSGVSPQVSEVHDTLLVHGSGFAEGAPARVTLDGQVFRAGSEAASVYFEAVAYAESREQLTLQVSEAMVNELCGTEQPRHATFMGDVIVAFRSRDPGAPPVLGRLKNTRLDFYPAPDGQVLPLDPEALAQFWGAEMGRPPELEGLLITSLRDNGKARESGLAPGDRVVQFDGLTVRGLSDLEPYPGQRRAQLSVLRGDSRNPLVVEVDVAGYAPRSAQAWTIGLGLCSAIALLLLLSRGPAALALSWVLSLRARAKQLDHREVLLGRASAQRARTPGRGIVPFLIVSVVWASLSLGLVRVPADLDLLLVLGLYAGGLLVVRLVGGGLGKRGWSLFRALKSVGRGLLTVGLVLLLLVPAVVMSSSLSLVDLVERQAGYPWSFAAFSNPSAYVVFGLLLSILVLQSLGVAPREPRTAQHGTARHVLLQGLNNLELVHLLLLCGLITVLYLGGWSWPQTWGESYGRLGPALLFQTKLTLMFLATVWLRGRLPRVPEHYLQGIYWKRILPLALGAALLAPVWTVSAWPSWLQPAATWSLLTLTALGLAAVVWVQRSHKAQVPSLNPWL